MEVRALIRTRCDNMEEDNKYLLGNDKRVCTLCRKGEDNWKPLLKSAK